MSLNCSRIISTDDNQYQIQLHEEDSSPLNARYFDSTFIWTLATIFMVLCLFEIWRCYVMYVSYDKKEKMKALSEFNKKTLCQTSVQPYLEPYCNFTTEVVNIIFEYADIKQLEINIKSRWGDSCVINNTFIVLIYVFLLAACLPTALSISHWNESYRSFVEIQCIAFYDDDRWKLMVQDLCINDTNSNFDDYTFYAYFTINHNTYNKATVNETCYINTDNFKVRGGVEGCECDCCCGSDCSRCGMCAGGCTNACCYGLSIMLTLFSCNACICGYWIVSEDYDEYKVSVETKDNTVLI